MSDAEALAVLARAYAYVRFFHPSDAAAAADWDALAVVGAPRAGSELRGCSVTSVMEPPRTSTVFIGGAARIPRPTPRGEQPDQVEPV